jgi:hypothetical protein
VLTKIERFNCREGEEGGLKGKKKLKSKDVMERLSLGYGGVGVL